jgi:aerobic carbon-monoxide dehydrogenase medium subunit
MFPAEFEYLTPTSLQEAATLLSARKGQAKVLAGGHSLIPLMKLRLVTPQYLIDISRIGELAYIHQEGDALAIGPMTTHHALETSELVARLAPLLAETAARIGDVQVRNRGTIGGSLAHADPGGDLPAAILALEAELKAVGPAGERGLKAQDFFVDLLTTALGEDEILTEVRIPIPAGRVGSAYLKFDNPASHYALVGIAAGLTLSADDTVLKARVGVTGVGPKAYRATRAEQVLEGKVAGEAAIAEAAEGAADGIDVAGDIHASSEYRAHLAKVYSRRALRQAAARARGS